MTEVHNRQAEGTTIPSIPQPTLDFSIPTVPRPSEPLPPYLPTESGRPASPTADGQGEVVPSQIALNDANDAVKTMKLDNAWGNVVERIKWVMDTLSPVAEVRLSFFCLLSTGLTSAFQLHPYAKMAWGLFSMIPRVSLCSVIGF